MVILRVLGIIDLLSGGVLLMLIFGMNVFYGIIVFCGLLSLLKGMFIFSGDVLSFIDLLSGITLLSALFFPVFIFLAWICALMLFAKGFASFF